jgi:exodeoxyribonuclease VII large subunit
MTYLHPRNKLREQQQRCVEFEQKIRNIMERRLNLAKQRLAISIEKMKGASPLAKLNQGFSYVSSEAGNVVKSIENVKLDDKLNIYMTDGIVRAKVVDTMKEDYNGRTNIGNSI